MKKLFSAAIAAGMALATAAHAAMVITVTEVNGDVVMTGSGVVVDENREDFNGSGSVYGAGSTNDNSVNEAYSIVGPTTDYMDVSSTAYGGAVTSLESVELKHTGNSFGYRTFSEGDTLLYVDGDYKTGAELEFTWIFRNYTVETLGTIFGTVYQTNSNSLTLIDGRPVPVPGALPLFLGVIGAGAAWRKKQR